MLPTISVSAGILSLDYAELPASLSAHDLPSLLFPWEVYTDLKKVNPTKSEGGRG